jgi:adenylate kinase family enzyme
MSVNPSAASLPHRPSRNCLLLLCGIPGAGKSTIASTLADSLGSGIDVVNYDSFLHAAMTADVSLDRENSLLGAEEGGVDSPAVFTAQAWHLSRQAAHNRVSELMSR